MANDQIKIGMQVVFEGVEGMRQMTSEIASAMQELQKVLDANVAQVQFAFDGSGMQKLQIMLEQIGALALDLAKLFGDNSNKTIKVEIQKEAIDQFKHTIENTFNEVLSRTREVFVEVADLLHDSLKSAAVFNAIEQQTMQAMAQRSAGLATPQQAPVSPAQVSGSTVQNSSSDQSQGSAAPSQSDLLDQIKKISEELGNIPEAIRKVFNEGSDQLFDSVKSAMVLNTTEQQVAQAIAHRTAQGDAASSQALLSEQIRKISDEIATLPAAFAFLSDEMQKILDKFDRVFLNFDQIFTDALSNTSGAFTQIAKDFTVEVKDIALALDQAFGKVVTDASTKFDNTANQFDQIFTDALNNTSVNFDKITDRFEILFGDILNNTTSAFDHIAKDLSNEIGIAFAHVGNMSPPDPAAGVPGNVAYQSVNFLYNRPKSLDEVDVGLRTGYANKLARTLVEEIRAAFSAMMIRNPQESAIQSKELGRPISIANAPTLDAMTFGGGLELSNQAKRAGDELGLMLVAIQTLEKKLTFLKSKLGTQREKPETPLEIADVEREIKRLEKDVETQFNTINRYNKQITEFKGYNKLMKDSIKADEKVVQHRGDVANYIEEAEGMLDIANSVDANAGSFEKFARPFEMINQTLRIGLQGLLRMIKATEALAEAARNDLRQAEEELGEAINKNENPVAIKKRESRVLQYRQKLLSFEGGTKLDKQGQKIPLLDSTGSQVFIDGKAQFEQVEGLIQQHKKLADEYYQSTSNVKILADKSRMWYRVLNEGNRVTEVALKAYQRLGQTVPVVVNQFKNLNQIGQQQGVLTEEQYGQVTTAINDRTKVIKEIDKNILKLKQAEEQQIAILTQEADQGQGLFATTAEPDRAKKLEQETKKLKDYTRDAIAEQEKRRQSLVDLEPDTAALEKKQSQYEFFLKLVKKAEEAERGFLTLEGISKTSNIGNFSFFEGDFKNKDIQSQAAIIKQVRSEYVQLSKTIGELKRDFIALGDSSSPKAMELAQTIEVLESKHADLTREVLGSDNQLQFAWIESLASSLKEIDSEVADLAQQYGNLQLRLQEAQKDLKGTNDEQLRGAQASLKMGSEAKSAEDKIRRHIKTLETLRSTTGSLTPAQEAQLRTLYQLAEGYRSAAAGIARKEWHLKRIERTTKDAGMGFQRYIAKISDSIAGNFQFIHSAALVASVVMAVRTAFNELKAESTALARTMTVMQSNSMTTAQTYEALRKTVRSTAIEFGESVQTVAEIVKQFGSAGLSAEESMRGLRDTMKLVISTQVSAEQASRSIAGIYNVFGKDIARTAGEMNTFGRITDVLTATYRNHQVELDEMIQGLKYSASTGRAAGFAFEDITAYLAVLNDNLIKSGTAGRTLQVVFSQLSSKADQVEKAFGFKFDKNKTLEEQFLPLLEKANGLMSAGALTAAQLQTQFKLFDLRGARSFVTLATNVNDVRKALRRLKDESTGTAEELAAIVKNDIAKQWESARQSIIDLIKGALDPLKDVLITVNGLIRVFTKGVKGLGIDQLFSIIGMTGAVISFVVSSLIAWMAVLATLKTRTWEAVTAQMAYVKATWQATYGAMANAAANRAQAGSYGMVATAATKASYSVAGALKGIGALLGGWPALIAIAFTALLYFVGKSKNKTEELSREFENLTGEMRRIDSVSVGLANFERDISLIEAQLKRGTIAAEVAGDKIKEAFENAGHLAVSQASIMGKSNVEIANSFDSVSESVKRQIELQKHLIEIERKRNKDKALKNINERIVEASTGGLIDTALGLKGAIEEMFIDPYIPDILKLTNKAANPYSSSFFSSDKESRLLGLNLDEQKQRDITRRLTPLEAYIEDIERSEKRIQEISKRINKDLTEKAKEEILEEAKAIREIGLEAANSYKERIDDLKIALNDLVNQGFTFEKAEDQIRKALDAQGYNRKTIEKIIKDLRPREKITFGIEKLVETDAFNATAQTFYDLNKFIGGVTDVEKFDELSDRMIKLEKDTSQVGKSMIQLSQALGTIEEITPEVKLGIDMDPDNFKLNLDVIAKSFANLISTTNPSEKLKEALIRELLEDLSMAATVFGLDVGRDENMGTDAYIEKLLKKQLEFNAVAGNTADEYDRIRVSAEGLAGVVQKVTGILGDQTFEQSEELKNLEAKYAIQIESARQERKTLEQIEEITKERDRQIDQLKQTLFDQKQVYAGFVDYIKQLTIEAMIQQTRNEIVKDYLMLIERSAEAQMFLNSRIQKSYDLETKRQKLVSTAKLIPGSLKGGRIDREVINAFMNEKAQSEATGNAEDQKEAFEKMMKKMEIPKELWDSFYAYAKALKDLEISDRQNEQKLEQAKLATAQIRRNIKGQAEDQKKASQTLVMSVRHRHEMLRLEEKLTGNYKDQLEALTEITTMVGDLTKAQNDVRDLYYSQNESLYSTLETIEQILNAEKEYAGFSFLVLRSASKINELMVRRQDILNAAKTEKDETLKQRRLIDLYSSQLDIFKEFMKIQQKLKSIEQEKNRFVDERLNLLKKIAEFSKDQGDFLRDQFRKGLESQFNLKPFETARNVALQIGWSTWQVLADQTQAIDIYVKNLERGIIKTKDIIDPLKTVGGALAESGESSLETNLQLYRLMKAEQDTALKNFEIFKGEQNIDGMERSLKRYEDLGENLRKLPQDTLTRALKLQGLEDVDLEAVYRDTLVKAAKLNEELSGYFGKTKHKFLIDFGFEDEDEFDATFIKIQDFLKEVKAELQEISGIDPSAAIDKLNEAIDSRTDGRIVQFTSDVIFKGMESEIANLSREINNLSASISRAEGLKGAADTKRVGASGTRVKVDVPDVKVPSLEDVQNTLQMTIDTSVEVSTEGAKGYNTGGPVPGGYGGGDIVPAMLEPGEFVIPKHIVKKLGLGFMEDLRSGNIKGYNTGGEVDRASARRATRMARMAVRAASGRSESNTDSNLLMQRAAQGALKVFNDLQGQASNVEKANAALGATADSLEQVAGNVKDASVDIKDAASEMSEAALMIRQAIQNAAQASSPSEAASGIVAKALEAATKAIGISTAELAAGVKTTKELTGQSREEVEQKILKAPGIEAEIEQQVKIGAEIINKSAIAKALKDSIVSGISKAGSAAQAIAESLTDISFAFENSELFKQYSEQLEEIEKQFEEQFETVTKGLRRNEISYYAYINALQDAEKQRMEQMIESEKQYRESIKKTQDIIGQKVQIFSASAFKGMTDAVSGGLEAVSRDLFGDPSKEIDRFAGEAKEILSDLGKSLAGVDFKQGFFDIVGAVGQLGQSLGGAGGSVYASIVTSILSGLMSGISGLMSLGFADDKTIEAIQNFIEELPEAVVEFVDRFVENLSKVIDALVEAIPAAVDAIVEAFPVVLMALVEALPTVLEVIVTKLADALPLILDALAEALPELVSKLVPLFYKLIYTVLSNIGGLVDILATIPAALLEGFLNAITDPSIWLLILKSVLNIFFAPFRLIINSFIGILNLLPRVNIPKIPSFHEGGLIKGNYEDVPIIAQSGEGVVSRKGMLALGGAEMLDKINSGINPFALERLESYNSPSMSSGIVRTGAEMNIGEGYGRSISSSDNSTTNNSISVNVNVSGPMTSSDVDKLSNQIVNDIDRKLAKKSQDRDSRLARSIR
jgi:TP901 family phage tail tape measure protein